jgi:hypothetical protein
VRAILVPGFGRFHVWPRRFRPLSKGSPSPHFAPFSQIATVPRAEHRSSRVGPPLWCAATAACCVGSETLLRLPPVCRAWSVTAPKEPVQPAAAWAIPMPKGSNAQGGGYFGVSVQLTTTPLT